jgi:hypothetical protein
MTGGALAAAAEALVGTRFRLHGRDAATGLDCIGVLGAALKACGRPAALPNFYSLRMRTPPGLAEVAHVAGFAPCKGVVLAGDVLLVRIGPCQFHLALAVDSETFVHAHAGLMRVVRSALPGDWLVVRHWRLAEKD